MPVYINRFNVTGGKITIENGGLHAFNYKQTGGDIIVGNKAAANAWSALGNVGGYNNFELAGGTMTVNEGGRLWIGSGDGDKLAGMVFSGGKLTLNGTATNQAVVSTMTLDSFGTSGTPVYMQTRRHPLVAHRHGRQQVRCGLRRHEPLPDADGRRILRHV